jgi:hypothetical protein
MNQVCAHAPAESSCRIGDGHEYRVTFGFVPDKKSIAIGATIRRGAEVYNEGVVKLICEARVGRRVSFCEETGFAAGNLHNQSLIDLGDHRFVAVRLNETCRGEQEKDRSQESHLPNVTEEHDARCRDEVQQISGIHGPGIFCTDIYRQTASIRPDTLIPTK